MSGDQHMCATLRSRIETVAVQPLLEKIGSTLVYPEIVYIIELLSTDMEWKKT